MDRRLFLGSVGTTLIGSFAGGCRSHQVGEVLTADKKDAVGNTAAGGETYKPLIDEALGKLLARQCVVQQVGTVVPGPKRICFVGLENKSSEELGDFKEQIIEIIDTKINTSGTFEPISKRFVEAGLAESRIRPDQLFVPANLQRFLAVMGGQGQSFEYLLFAKLTSGTTQSTRETQKEYLLTLDLVNIQSGKSDKESASLRKGYHKSHGLR